MSIDLRTYSLSYRLSNNHLVISQTHFLIQTQYEKLNKRYIRNKGIKGDKEEKANALELQVEEGEKVELLIEQNKAFFYYWRCRRGGERHRSF